MTVQAIQDEITQSEKSVKALVDRINRLRKAHKAATEYEKQLASILPGVFRGQGSKRIHVRGRQWQILEGMRFGRGYSAKQIAQGCNCTNQTAYNTLSVLVWAKLIRRERNGGRVTFYKIADGNATTPCGARSLGV